MGKLTEEEKRERRSEYQRDYRRKNLQRFRGYDQKRRPAKGKKREKLTHEQFVTELALKNNTLRVDSEYIAQRFRINVTCLVCQHSWSAFAGKLLQGNGCERGNGCMQCFLNRLRGSISRKRIKHEDFVKRARSVNDTIQIDSPYKTFGESIDASCLKCGHKWSPLASNVLKGQGCPKCSPYGFRQDKSGFLYYVRISANGNFFYKVGITNRSVSKRFKHDYAKMTILETVWCENGAEAFEMEKEILREYADYRYRGPHILDSGNREIFIKDVLNLDVAA